MGVLAILGAILFFRRRNSLQDSPRTPRIVRLAFAVEVLVLFSPLFARFGNLQPEHVRGQVAASIIILFSAALGIYYLLVNPGTRLGAGSSLKRS